jgi:phage baseplate assembly protein V
VNQQQNSSRGKPSGSSKGKSSLHFGYVSEVDAATGRARVKLQDMQGMDTYWLAILQTRVKEDQYAVWVDPGDFVACMLDEKGEQGVILGCLYSQKNPPPITTLNKHHVTFQDGSLFEFDRSTGILTINCTKIVITGTEESTINGKAITVVTGVDSAGHPIVSSGQ